MVPTTTGTRGSQKERNHQSQQAGSQVTSHQNLAATMHYMLDMYYTSLCQPAFPEAGEKSSMASPQHYLDQYQLLHHQAVAQQYHGGPTGHQSSQQTT